MIAGRIGDVEGTFCRANHADLQASCIGTEQVNIISSIIEMLTTILTHNWVRRLWVEVYRIWRGTQR